MNPALLIPDTARKAVSLIVPAVVFRGEEGRARRLALHYAVAAELGGYSSKYLPDAEVYRFRVSGVGERAGEVRDLFAEILGQENLIVCVP